MPRSQKLLQFEHLTLKSFCQTLKKCFCLEFSFDFDCEKIPNENLLKRSKYSQYLPVLTHFPMVNTPRHRSLWIYLFDSSLSQSFSLKNLVNAWCWCLCWWNAHQFLGKYYFNKILNWNSSRYQKTPCGFFKTYSPQFNSQMSNEFW